MEFFKAKLSNGATLIGERRDTQAVAVGYINPIGSGSDPLRKSGLNHLHEHDAFRGGPYSRRINRAHRVEYSGGITNASTTYCSTSFYCKLPSEKLEEAIDFLQGIILRPTLDQEAFEKERRVVIAEIGEYHDSPAGRLEDLSMESLFKPPFNRPILGTEESLSKIEREDLFWLWRGAYNPRNCCFGIVGDFDKEEAIKLFSQRMDLSHNKNTGSLRRHPIIPRLTTIVEEREGLDHVHLSFGIHVPGPRSNLRYALYALDSYLSSKTCDSFLFKSLRDQEGLVYSVDGAVQFYDTSGVYSIDFSTDPRNLRRVLKLIKEGFASVENMNNRKLNRVKEMLIGSNRINEDRSEERLSSLLELEGEYRIGAESFYRYEEGVSGVTLEQIKRLSKIRRYSLAALVPKESMDIAAIR